MKILITGVAGFIGSNLAEALLKAGHHIIGLDNMSQGDMLNMAAFKSHPQFQFIKGDILDQECFNNAASGCDVRQGMACAAAVPVVRGIGAGEG